MKKKFCAAVPLVPRPARSIEQGTFQKLKVAIRAPTAVGTSKPPSAMISIHMRRALCDGGVSQQLKTLLLRTANNMTPL